MRGRVVVGGDTLSSSVVPFIDVLLVLVVLLVVMAAGGAGQLKALPVKVPVADGRAVENDALPTFIVADEVLRVVGAGTEPIALPAERPDNNELLVFCTQAGLQGAASARVGAKAQSTHEQLVGLLAFLGWCGVTDISLLVRPQ